LKLAGNRKAFKIAFGEIRNVYLKTQRAEPLTKKSRFPGFGTRSETVQIQDR